MSDPQIPDEFGDEETFAEMAEKFGKRAVVAEAEVTRLRNLWQVELRNAERLADENDILQAKLDAVSDELAGARQDRNSASARATRLADERDILQAKLDAVRAQRDYLLTEMQNMAMQHPDWHGQRVTRSENRQQLLDRAFYTHKQAITALDEEGPGDCSMTDAALDEEGT